MFKGKTKFIAALMVASLLSACSIQIVPGGNTSESSSSQSSSAAASESTSSATSESSSSATSESTSSATSESSTSQSSTINTYSVIFYDGDEVYDNQSVTEGSKVNKPADPTKEGFDFKGWYLDKACTIPFDFETEIVSATDVFAKWEKKTGDFTRFDERFTTAYSPFAFDQKLFIGQKDPVLNFSCKDVDFSSNISPNQIYLGGSFSTMDVKNITVDGDDIKVALDGEIEKGKGVVAFAKELTAYDQYFATAIDVTSEAPAIDPISVTYKEKSGKGTISFDLALEDDAIINPESLSADDYLAKLKDGTYPYFIISSNEKYNLEITSVAEDFSKIGFKLSLPEKVSNEVLEELKSSEIIASKDAFVSGLSRSFPLDFTGYTTKTELHIYRIRRNKYQGVATINLGKLNPTEGIKNPRWRVYSGTVPKNSFITIPDETTCFESLSIIGERAFEVNFEIESENFTATRAYIDLSPVQIHVDLTPLVRTIWNKESEDLVIPPVETIDFEVELKKYSTGTVSQTTYSSYTDIRTDVQEEMRQGTDKMTELMSQASGIAKVGYGVYSGNYTMAMNAIGDMFGMDSLRNPSFVIMDRLKDIMDELKVIETKLDNLYSKLNVIEEELEKIGETALLSNFLTAHASWIAFVTDYYTPLTDQISLYTNQYFRYYYDLAKKSSIENGLNISLYYDHDGELAFPDEYGRESIDFKLIDKSKTKTVRIPELASAIAGIRANKGHSYLEIEDDVIADIANHGGVDDALLRDISKTLRFHAMKSYFDTQAKMDNFINVLNNFRRSLTGTQLQTAINPLDAYATMLATIYNFGFETEPEMNLAIIKLSTTYHVATNMAEYVHLMNSGSLAQTDADAELHEQVMGELSDSRFFRPNDENGHPYCYASDCYVGLECNSYSIFFTPGEWGYSSFNKNCHADGPKYEANVRSISEADVRFINVKARVLNQIKHTNYTFQDYFCSIGVIPKELNGWVNGVILDFDEIVHGRDAMLKLSFDSKFSYNEEYGDEVERYVKTAKEVYNKDKDDYKSAKGKMYSFKDEGEIYTGLAAIACTPDEQPDVFDEDEDVLVFVGGYFYGYDIVKEWGWRDPEEYHGGCYAYYVTIYPL